MGNGAEISRSPSVHERICQGTFENFRSELGDLPYEEGLGVRVRVTSNVETVIPVTYEPAELDEVKSKLHLDGRRSLDLEICYAGNELYGAVELYIALSVSQAPEETIRDHLTEVKTRYLKKTALTQRREERLKKLGKDISAGFSTRD